MLVSFPSFVIANLQSAHAMTLLSAGARFRQALAASKPLQIVGTVRELPVLASSVLRSPRRAFREADTVAMRADQCIYRHSSRETR